MKLILLTLLCISINSFAKGQHKIDTTPEIETDVFTIQAEENYYHVPNSNSLPVDTNYLNLSIGYSFDFGLDLQLITYNCPLSGGGAQNYECDTFFNMTQTVNITEYVNVITGIQNGISILNPINWHNIDFSVISYSPIKEFEGHFGSYFVNKSEGTIGIDVIGYTGGFIYNVYDKFRIESDYFNGHNNLSGAQINFFYDWGYLGIIVPETNSGNEFAGVIGVKYTFKH